MEDRKLKKILSYSLAALLLGTFLTLIPLIILVEPKSLDVYTSSSSMKEQLQGLERYTSLKRTTNLTDIIVVLSASLIVAYIGYAFFKHRITG